MLDYKLIEAMAAVVQEGGFDRAARVLFLSQSAVSQRVKLLEEQTGQLLLVRSSPPRATPAGRRMLKHYLQVKRLEDDLGAAFSVSAKGRFVDLVVGLNADSLATWFIPAIRPFLEENSVVLDMRVDDQEETHRLLRDGEVVGCITARDQPMQGCRMEELGCMDYRLCASPLFSARWFPRGLTLAGVAEAPALIFNRKDDLHNKLFRKVLGSVPPVFPAHYLPSSEKFVDFIASGLAYGMLPDQQSTPLINRGIIKELAPSHSISVRLYWHCWNLKSQLLEELSHHLVSAARRVLKE